MDKKTEKVLSRISKNVPQHLQKNIVKTIVDTTQEDLARAAIKDPKISEAKKKELKKLIDSGAFRKSEQVEDEDVIKKIDEYNTKAVKKAIASGEIPPPEKDAWAAKRNQKMKTTISTQNKVIPIHDRVLVKPLVEPTETKTRTGILLPDSQKKKSAIGFIVAVGPKVESVKKGMKVAFEDYGYDPLEVNKETFYVMKEQSIIAILI